MFVVVTNMHSAMGAFKNYLQNRQVEKHISMSASEQMFNISILHCRLP